MVFGMSLAEKTKTIAENVPKVFEAGKQVGKQAEYDRFWDANQDNGNRENYRYGYYGASWTNDNFHPKYKIKPTIATSVFQSCGATIFDAEMDWSKITDAGNMFMSSRFTELPEVDLENATYNKAYMFAAMHGLVSLRIKVNENTTYVSNMFQELIALTELEIIGTIGKNGFNVNGLPLTHDSLIGILYALQDKTGDTSGTSWVCTLGATNLAKLTDAEKAIATQKGWSLL
jgi:hypothetical protein